MAAAATPGTAVSEHLECKWRAVSNPGPGQPLGTSNLAAVAAISATDIWAVGDFNGSGDRHTFTEHWDGSSWGISSSPSPGAFDHLTAVSAISTNDVWAVGYSSAKTLTEHWDGNSWSVIPSPSPGSSAYLFGTTALSPHNVWAVGASYDAMSINHSLIEHWDGTTWSVVPSPSPSEDFLFAVTASSASDVWAVGSTNFNQNTLIEHWDGSTWSVVASPSPDLLNTLNGVASISASDVWAVGRSQGASSLSALTMHWNGSTWSAIPSAPEPPNSVALFNGVAGRSSSDVWAVGNSQGSAGTPALIEHWDGGGWTLVPAENPAPSNELNGVAVVSTVDAWAVGRALQQEGDYAALVEHFSCLPVTAPSPTPTPPTLPKSGHAEGPPAYAWLPVIVAPLLLGLGIAGGKLRRDPGTQALTLVRNNRVPRRRPKLR